MFTRFWAMVRRQTMMLKAASFAMVGLVNTVIDAGVFFVAFAALSASATASGAIAAAAEGCGCTSATTLTLVVANLIAWAVAVSCSYVLNSYITFAAESGRQLRLRDYGAFVASGVAGVTVNTTVLVLAAKVMPVWAAKLLAILASFCVNFTLAQFVVFRRRPGASAPTQ